MKRLLAAVLLASVMLVSGSAFASQAQFCAGYREGYKSIKGSMAIVPICPIAPITPVGSTPFSEGIKAGMWEAMR